MLITLPHPELVKEQVPLYNWLNPTASREQVSGVYNGVSGRYILNPI